MIDIVDFTTADMVLLNTQTPRAANILNTQLGELEYAQDLGIDLRYFLTDEVTFQNENFKGYIIQSLAARGINLTSLVEVLKSLDSDYNIKLSPVETSTGFVTR